MLICTLIRRLANRRNCVSGQLLFDGQDGRPTQPHSLTSKTLTTSPVEMLTESPFKVPDKSTFRSCVEASERVPLSNLLSVSALQGGKDNEAFFQRTCLRRLGFT